MVALLAIASPTRATEGWIQLDPDCSGRPSTMAATRSLPTGSVEFSIDPPAAGATLSVAAKGMVPSSPDNTVAFQRAIDAAKAQGAAKIVIPKGTYYFNSKTQIQLKNIKDLEIDGQGSELIFKDLGYFYVNGVDRVWIHDLSIDWDWNTRPLAYLGIIASKADGAVVLRFPQVREIPENITWVNAEQIEPKTFEPLAGGANPYFVPTNVTRSGRAELTVTNPWLAAQPVGSAFRLRQYQYDRPAFDMSNATHVKFERVQLWGAPGMGFVVYRDSHHLEWRRVKVLPRPGTQRIISTTADVFHINQSQGFFRWEKCEIAFQGDDGINIKDNAAHTLTKIEANTLKLTDVPRWRFPLDAGDVLEFRGPDYRPAGHSPPISSVSLSDTTATVVFSGPLPALDEKSFIWNTRYSTQDYIIRGNVFHSARGRGVLAKARNGTIEGNTFRDNSGNGIQVNVGPWKAGGGSEGTYVDNLVIRNNRFLRTNRHHWGDAIITSDMKNMPVGPPYWKAFQNILIEGNTLDDFPDGAIRLRHNAHVTITGNTFKFGALLSGGAGKWGCIGLTYCDDIALCCNAWKGAFPASNQGAYYDPCNCNRISSCSPPPDPGR